jgi:hypothetical protein
MRTIPILLSLALAAPAWAQPAPAPAPAGAPAAKKVKMTTQLKAKMKGQREYKPPVMDPEPALEPSKAAVVEGKGDGVGVYARPWYPSPRIGTLWSHARSKVRGQVPSKQGERICGKAPWYGIEPFGYVCSTHVTPTKAEPSTVSGFNLKEGERLPYRYAMAKKGAKANQFASVDDIDGNNIQRTLSGGDSIAISGSIEHNGTKYHRTADGMLVEAENIVWMGGGSTWQGVHLKPDEKFPFGWTRNDRAPVRAEAQPKAKIVDKLALRTRLELLGETGEGKNRFWKVGEGRFLAAADVSVVRKIAPPEGVLTSPEKQWIDIDTGEQVLVLYEHLVPVYATLTSSGRSIKTPRGNYPIWARVLAHTMKNQAYEDGQYHMARVPWTTFFQTHNAIHGCYWHSAFGQPRSHGCVNLSPLDSRYVFDWVRPKLPPGWFGIRPANLLESVTVHVRNSHLDPPFVQERFIGPPDKDIEAKKREWADKRRTEKAAKEAAKPPAPAPAP